MAEEKELQTGVVDVNSPEEVFKALRGEITRITIMRDGKVLDRALPEEVDDDVVFWVKEKYGGGKYQLILFGADGRVKKRLSFAIDGTPKFPQEEKEGSKDAMVELLSKLVEKLEEKRRSPSESELTTVFEKMMEMQMENTKTIIELLKNEKPKEKGFLDSLIDKVLSNPQILLAAGSGLWKLIQKAIANKNELLELIKVAKDDPELKELAIQAVGAKYGGGGGIIDRILSNPELLNKTLDIVNKALAIREAGQNPIPTVKRELHKLARNGQQIKQSTTVVDTPVDSGKINEVRGEEVSVVGVQEVVALGTKILDLAEKGANAGQIWDSLSDEEIDILIALTEQYGIKDSEGLVRLLEELPVPRFTVAGYIDAVKRHKAVIDELLSYLFAEEVGEDSQEGPQESEQVYMQVVDEQVNRETTGDLSGELQANHRKITGEG
ncbi:hypothetical protein [Phorcysia thermohydrogeniphila]|uniref:Uncharacterized protein n=1 Tax=Phorcysia thermohydrogeniphila TaxID=936138 RepID=A0A4R1GDF1_9BACT|nr:hypothetical protein [Phorcysia thermohydrogeniphila]TCK06347.1 hypothetical protein CLV27_0148 [Phorcysia thermohydrogeniphila]